MAIGILRILGKKPPINDIDVGAMTLGAEHDAYYNLAQANIARVIGFEPVPEECEKLNALVAKGNRFLPYALGDGSERTLHVCNFPMNTSLYEPNRELLDRFQNLGHMFDVVERVPVTTKRMHDLQGNHRYGFSEGRRPGRRAGRLARRGTLAGGCGGCSHGSRVCADVQRSASVRGS